MDEIYLKAIIAAIGALAALGIFFLMRRPRAQGSSVRECLASLGGDYTVLSDILVTLKRGMFQIDHLVVSRYGMVLIDERDEKGTVEGKPGQRDWKVTGLGRKEIIYNPLWRLRVAANSLEAQVGSIPITSLVVFVNARLKRAAGDDAVSLDGLPARIRQHAKPVLDEEQVNKILERLGSK